MVAAWPYPHQHRFTKSEVRRVMDALNSYAYQWGLRAVSPFHEVKRAVHSRHTDSGFDGWELLHADLKPVRRLVKDLESAKGGHFLPIWFALRDAGFRPVVESNDPRWTFKVGTVPLDYALEIEPQATRKGIAAISRWTWCKGCDLELAVTRSGFCESCALAPVGQSPDDLRPIGAPLGYVPEATL